MAESNAPTPIAAEARWWKRWNGSQDTETLHQNCTFNPSVTTRFHLGFLAARFTNVLFVLHQRCTFNPSVMAEFHLRILGHVIPTFSLSFINVWCLFHQRRCTFTPRSTSPPNRTTNTKSDSYNSHAGVNGLCNRLRLRIIACHGRFYLW